MIKFSDFVDQWLYADDGYYAKAPIVGQKGDFFTSVSTSQFFGGAIANYLVESIHSGKLPKDTVVCEIGSHQGYLLADIVQFVYSLDQTLLDSLRFAVVEPLEELREIQRNYFDQSFGSEVEILHFESLEEVSFDSGFVVANELFDAFAFEIVSADQMAFVSDQKIVWGEIDSTTKALAKRHDITKGEVFVGFDAFARSLKKVFKKLEFVTFDYGEFVPRGDISARVYQANKTYPLFEIENFEKLFKNSDITADVNFDQLISSFEAEGFSSSKLTTQSVALIEMGILKLLETLQEKAGFEAYQKEVGRIRALIDPAMMGERFKCVKFYAET